MILENINILLLYFDSGPDLQYPLRLYDLIYVIFSLFIACCTEVLGLENILR
jgi:hypothetical protein